MTDKPTINLKEIEALAVEAIAARNRFNNGAGIDFRKLEGEWNIAEMRYEQEATPEAILALIAEVKRLREAAHNLLAWNPRNGSRHPFEWSMGCGQCPFCFGKLPGMPWADNSHKGHESDCVLAELKEAASE